jgi:DMSO/TMAO reductase YedYZ heme-binding membrane subunit
VSGSPLTLAQQLEDAHLRFGLGALSVLMLLGATSFPRVVARLHLRSWKELHRLVYVAWLCCLLHACLSPYAFMPGVLAMALLFVVASLSRLLPRRSPGR